MKRISLSITKETPIDLQKRSFLQSKISQNDFSQQYQSNLKNASISKSIKNEIHRSKTPTYHEPISSSSFFETNLISQPIKKTSFNENINNRLKTTGLKPFKRDYNKEEKENIPNNNLFNRNNNFKINNMMTDDNKGFEKFDEKSFRFIKNNEENTINYQRNQGLINSSNYLMNNKENHQPIMSYNNEELNNLGNCVHDFERNKIIISQIVENEYKNQFNFICLFVFFWNIFVVIIARNILGVYFSIKDKDAYEEIYNFFKLIIFTELIMYTKISVFEYHNKNMFSFSEIRDLINVIDGFSSKTIVLIFNFICIFIITKDIYFFIFQDLFLVNLSTLNEISLIFSFFYTSQFFMTNKYSISIKTDINKYFDSYFQLFMAGFFNFFSFKNLRKYGKLILILYFSTVIACDLKIGYYLSLMFLSEQSDYTDDFFFNSNFLITTFSLIIMIIFLLILLEIPLLIARKIRKKCIESLNIFSNTNPLYIYNFISQPTEKSLTNEYYECFKYFYINMPILEKSCLTNEIFTAELQNDLMGWDIFFVHCQERISAFKKKLDQIYFEINRSNNWLKFIDISNKSEKTINDIEFNKILIDCFFLSIILIKDKEGWGKISKRRSINIFFDNLIDIHNKVKEFQLIKIDGMKVLVISLENIDLILNHYFKLLQVRFNEDILNFNLSHEAIKHIFSV